VYFEKNKKTMIASIELEWEDGKEADVSVFILPIVAT
jgi:hypothetical protein